MDAVLLIIAGCFGLGVLIGGITRSAWALLYPALLIAVLGLAPTLMDAPSDRLTHADLALLNILGFGVPALLGTLIGIGVGKANKSRG